jgi:hypothetical protein
VWCANQEIQLTPKVLDEKVSIPASKVLLLLLDEAPGPIHPGLAIGEAAQTVIWPDLAAARSRYFPILHRCFLVP